MTTLVKELQENLDSTKEEFNQSVNKRIEEGNSKIQHKVVTQINDNFEKLEQTKCEEKFKFKASGAAIARIVEIRVKLREAGAEGERDFEDFWDTATGKILADTLEVLDRQEGLIRLAESSKHGYKVVDKLQEDNKSYSYISDPELVKKVKAAEKELDKEDEVSKKFGSSSRRHYRSRSGSRSRSRSPTRREKKGSSPRRSRGGYGFECYWCGKQGHS